MDALPNSLNCEETPPLARRKHPLLLRRFLAARNTSACAEKTDGLDFLLAFLEKHLRLRGENVLTVEFGRPKLETPPLARRKPSWKRFSGLYVRNTSACAEKTNSLTCHRGYSWKHLRLRGENLYGVTDAVIVTETPPLARRKLREPHSIKLSCGNTSACAEKTGGSLNAGNIS